MTQPSYYSILTAAVRYDNDLIPNAKILYSEITALANTSGVCTASNGYFSKLYGVGPTTISEWISQLDAKGYISVFIDRAAGNKRKIRIAIAEIPKTSSGKAEDPSSGKAEDNTTSINTKYNIPTNQIYREYLKCFVLGMPNSDTVGDTLIASAASKYRLTPKRKAAIARRLDECEAGLIMQAVKGYALAPWSNGNNDRKWTADLADFICRNYENIERGARELEKYAGAGSQETNPFDGQ